MRIVLFGDSITQQSFSPGGWGARLADHFVRRADVQNRGYSGYNTRWALQLLDKLFPPAAEGVATAPCLVTVFFGANDAALPDQGSARQHVPLAEYKDNLRAIVAAVRAAGGASSRMVLMTPPPVHEGQRLEWQVARYGSDATGVAERTDEAAAAYGTAVRELARELSLPCLDVRAAMLGEGAVAWPAMLSDGLHLSAAGSAFVFDKLIDLVNTRYPELRVAPCACERRLCAALPPLACLAACLPVRSLPACAADTDASRPSMRAATATGSTSNSGSSSQMPHDAPWHDEIDVANLAASFH